jgi:hypothetical protein
MAKVVKSMNFKNATIDSDKNLITEVDKNETRFYSLSKLIDEWSGIDGLSITIKEDNELESDEPDDNYDDNITSIKQDSTDEGTDES